jgi:hypothetical protein
VNNQAKPCPLRSSNLAFLRLKLQQKSALILAKPISTY